MFSFSWLQWRKFAVHGNPRLSKQRVGIVWLQSYVRLESVMQKRDMERHKLQLGLLLFQSTKLLLSGLSSNEPIMCGLGLLKMYVTF